MTHRRWSSWRCCGRRRGCSWCLPPADAADSSGQSTECFACNPLYSRLYLIYLHLSDQFTLMIFRRHLPGLGSATSAHQTGLLSRSSASLWQCSTRWACGERGCGKPRAGRISRAASAGQHQSGCISRAASAGQHQSFLNSPPAACRVSAILVPASRISPTSPICILKRGATAHAGAAANSQSAVTCLWARGSGNQQTPSTPRPILSSSSQQSKHTRLGAAAPLCASQSAPGSPESWAVAAA